MSSLPTIEPFKGTDWEECDDFIRAIRAAAWKEGKIQDPRWIADFASLHFSRKARTWYCRLPQDVRQDWENLEVALSDRWTPPEDEDEPRIEPTPAAAPSLNRSRKANLSPEGVLRLAIDGDDEDFYLKVEVGDGRAELTVDANRALRIRCNSLSNTTILERIDGSHHSWLAIHWQSENPNLKNGSTDYGFLVLVDSLTLKTSWGAGSSCQFASCTISADGEVIPVWKNKDTKIAIGTFWPSGGKLCLAADPNAYAKRWPGESKAKMFIERID